MRRQIYIDPGTPIVRLGGRPGSVVTGLLIQQVGTFLVYAFADGPAWVGQHLAASAGKTLAALQLYQPLTAPLLHLRTQPLLFDALVLWVFGAALERWWGGRRLLLFWAVTAVAGVAVGTLCGLLLPTARLAGSAGAAAAMLLATAALWPRHLIHLHRLLPIKALHLALPLGAMLVLGDLLGARYLEAAVQLGGAAAALPFLYPPLRRLRRWRLRRAQRRLGVIEGGKARPERYVN